MKRIILIMAVLLAGLTACEKEVKQTAACEIATPADGTELDLKNAGSVKITGKGSLNVGNFSEVILSVGGNVIKDIDRLPFDYEYTFPENQEAGNLEIELKVTGNKGAVASDKVSLKLVRTEDPQVITCKLSAPTDNSEIEIPTVSTLRIAGNGAIENGTIAKVTLRFADEIIESVSSLPFEIDYPLPENLTEGSYQITLEAEGDKGAYAKDEVIVKITEKEQVTSCELTAPEENMEIKIPATRVIFISGNGSVNYGTISKAVLEVGSDTVGEVTQVPFAIEYTLPETLNEGDLDILLTVYGDKKTTAQDKVTVKVIKEDKPILNEDEFLDSRDGKIYKTINLNGQVWFAENLAWLPAVCKSESANKTDGKQRYFVLNYDGENVEEAKATEEYKMYGVLYNWYAAMGQDNAESADPEAVPSGVKGSCPEGWHIPSKAEWVLMEEYVASQLPDVKGNGMYIDLGIGDPYWEFEDGLKNVWSAVAATSGWEETSMGDENPDLKNGPRNTFGLSIIPAGQCYHTGGFGFSNSFAYFWHTELQKNGGGQVAFSNNEYRPTYSKSGISERRGFSVRCVKD